jgi:hypothetical protein
MLMGVGVFKEKALDKIHFTHSAGINLPRKRPGVFYNPSFNKVKIKCERSRHFFDCFGPSCFLAAQFV